MFAISAFHSHLCLFVLFLCMFLFFFRFICLFYLFLLFWFLVWIVSFFLFFGFCLHFFFLYFLLLCFGCFVFFFIFGLSFPSFLVSLFWHLFIDMCTVYCDISHTQTVRTKTFQKAVACTHLSCVLKETDTSVCSLEDTINNSCYYEVWQLIPHKVSPTPRDRLAHKSTRHCSMSRNIQYNQQSHRTVTE